MRTLALPTRLLASTAAAMLLLVSAVAVQGCSKTQCQEGSDAEFPKEAPIEAEFKSYLPEGATACGPETPGSDWKKAQRFSYDMKASELKEKFRSKNPSLQPVECKLPGEDRVCFADGRKRLSADFFDAQGAVLRMNFTEETAESLGAICTAAHKAMKGKGDFVGKLTKLIAKCGEACDAEHTSSCGHLDKGLGAICNTNKGICKKLCGTLKGKSAKKRACDLSK